MKITSITPSSPAFRAKLQIGDELLSVGGHEIADVIDLRYHTYDAALKLKILRGGREHTVRVRKGEGEELGIVGEDIMDSARRCANCCVFCFIDQLPPGMRETLYFKDDDVRMSFLMGNYISLTNLTERDISRIVELRISPVNVSVHVTDPAARVRMLGNPKAGECLEIMKMLAAHRIMMNCQIVLCPGFNDGALLEKTLADLCALFPAVPSISVVPVGLTKHREGLCHLNPVEKADALAAIECADRFGEACLEKYGTRVVYPADELYLKAELPIPPAEYYEDFPQIENGVGLMASFEDEVRAAAEDFPKNAEIRPFSIATGLAAEGFMRRMLEILLPACDNIYCDNMYNVYGVPNRFFGEQITVAGLVTGQDIVRTLTGKPLGERLLIPEVMLRHGERVFLDDMRVEDVEEALGVKVVSVPNDGAEFVRAVFDVE
jgi:putative radical SAM enzyme (TIGR03279 family)